MSEARGGTKDARRWHAGFWPALAVSAALATAGLFVAAKWIWPPSVYWLGMRYDLLDQQVARIARPRTLGGPGQRVVYLGDSTVSSYEKGDPLPARSERMLKHLLGERRIEVVNGAAPGAGVTQYAFLSDVVAGYQPDLVVWQISFFQLTDRWTRENGAPELVGFVDADRLPALLAMPFERYRLSLADILLQQSIARLGLHDLHTLVREAQIRFGHIRDVAEDALDPNARGNKPEKRAQLLQRQSYLGRHREPGPRVRYSAHGERVHFEDTLEGLDEDDPLLRLLGWGIRPLTERGIDVLVYLNPTNIENLERVGVYDEAGLARTVDALRATVESNGAHFLDLHAMLSDEAFLDAAGHFDENEHLDAPRFVVSQVSEAMLPILKARRESADAEAEGTP